MSGAGKKEEEMRVSEKEVKVSLASYAYQASADPRGVEVSLETAPVAVTAAIPARGDPPVRKRKLPSILNGPSAKQPTIEDPRIADATKSVDGSESIDAAVIVTESELAAVGLELVEAASPTSAGAASAITTDCLNAKAGSSVVGCTATATPAACAAGGIDPEKEVSEFSAFIQEIIRHIVTILHALDVAFQYSSCDAEAFLSALLGRIQFFKLCIQRMATVMQSLNDRVKIHWETRIRAGTIFQILERVLKELNQLSNLIVIEPSPWAQIRTQFFLIKTSVLVLEGCQQEFLSAYQQLKHQQPQSLLSQSAGFARPASISIEAGGGRAATSSATSTPVIVSLPGFQFHQASVTDGSKPLSLSVDLPSDRHHVPSLKEEP